MNFVAVLTANCLWEGRTFAIAMPTDREFLRLEHVRMWTCDARVPILCNNLIGIFTLDKNVSDNCYAIHLPYISPYTRSFLLSFCFEQQVVQVYSSRRNSLCLYLVNMRGAQNFFDLHTRTQHTFAYASRPMDTTSESMNILNPTATLQSEWEWMRVWVCVNLMTMYLKARNRK